jgi:hypothetical protein
MGVIILTFSYIALGPDNYVRGAVFGLRVLNGSVKLWYFVRSELTGAEDLATEVTILLSPEYHASI